MLQVKKVSCVSYKSNPPPEMKWYLGERELPSVQKLTVDLNQRCVLPASGPLEKTTSLRVSLVNSVALQWGLEYACMLEVASHHDSHDGFVFLFVP